MTESVREAELFRRCWRRRLLLARCVDLLKAQIDEADSLAEVPDQDPVGFARALLKDIRAEVGADK